MIFQETELSGSYIIKPEKSVDERGFFSRLFCKEEFSEHSLNPDIIQCNASYNERKGTFRGMHFQVAPFEENKMVMCTRGAIRDIIVDLRPDSPTFKKWISVELSEENLNILYVPKSFAHGFLTLKDHTTLFYMMTELHNPLCARGFSWNDKAFNIHLPEPIKQISKRDQEFPDFSENLLEAFVHNTKNDVKSQKPKEYENSLL